MKKPKPTKKQSQPSPSRTNTEPPTPLALGKQTGENPTQREGSWPPFLSRGSKPEVGGPSPFETKNQIPPQLPLLLLAIWAPLFPLLRPAAPPFERNQSFFLPLPDQDSPGSTIFPLQSIARPLTKASRRAPSFG